MYKVQNKHTVTYRATDEEQELYQWVQDKAKRGGPANAIKRILFSVMDQEKKINSNK